MGSWADTFVASVVSTLASGAAPGDIQPMTAYMRHQFLFLGVKAPAQKAAGRAALCEAGRATDEDEVVAAIDALWARPEREHRYAGCHLAGRFAPKASTEFVDHVARWVTTDPWWDTCDPLARRPFRAAEEQVGSPGRLDARGEAGRRALEVVHRDGQTGAGGGRPDDRVGRQGVEKCLHQARTVR
ncbi:MAG TPA: DNA alkylation repair protein [Acidimicrobiales bacterium]|nr:DNA alkylation repair protein [Acidimicrobiales bacterium]